MNKSLSITGTERMIDMAYNNGFPVNYQPAQFYYPQQNSFYPQQAQTQMQNQMQIS